MSRDHATTDGGACFPDSPYEETKCEYHRTRRAAMDLTELAHWEYRCAALEKSVREIEKLLRDIVGDNFFVGDAPALEAQLDYERWLLAEARYKTTLGRWGVTLANTTQKHVEFLTDLKRGIRYNAHDFGELGRFIRTSYLDNMIDEQIRRIENGS